MYEQIYYQQATASRRRCHATLFSTSTGQPLVPLPSLTGVKVYWSKDGATPAASTNDVVATHVNLPGCVYIEATTAELLAWGSGTILGSVKDATGAQPEPIQFQVLPYDPDDVTTPVLAELKKVNGVTLGAHAGTSLDPFGP